MTLPKLSTCCVEPVYINAPWFGPMEDATRNLHRWLSRMQPSSGLSRVVLAVVEVARLERDYRRSHDVGETRGDWVASGGRHRLRAMQRWSCYAVMWTADAFVALGNGNIAGFTHLTLLSNLAASLSKERSRSKADELRTMLDKLINEFEVSK